MATKRLLQLCIHIFLYITLIYYFICLTFVLYCIAVMRIVGEATVFASVIVIFWQKLLLPWSFLSEYRQKKDWVGLQTRNSSQPVSDCWFSRDKQRKLSSDQHIGSNILVKYELSRSQSKAMIKSASTERLRFHTNLISSPNSPFSASPGKKTTKIVRRWSQTSFLNKTPLEKFKSQEESRAKAFQDTWETWRPWIQLRLNSI